MVTNKDAKGHVVLGNGYDIGLVFPKYSDIIKLQLKHLRLPDRYALYQINCNIYNTTLRMKSLA